MRDLEGAPRAGLAILIDGDAAGFTNADGMLELARDEAPVRIEVDAPGLRPIPAYPVISKGTRRMGWYVVRLGDSSGRESPGPGTRSRPAGGD